jgi:hypothetical protein
MLHPTATASLTRIHPISDQPPGLAIPPGHVGPLTLPGSRRTVWWTGRVAIGLRHEHRPGVQRPMSASALWLQSLLLSGSARRAQAA